eukprot:765823-Hanusia_phi.AAC.1
MRQHQEEAECFQEQAVGKHDCPIPCHGVVCVMMTSDSLPSVGAYRPIHTQKITREGLVGAPCRTVCWWHGLEGGFENLE